MDQDLIEKYKNEMLRMYRSQRAVPVAAQTQAVTPQSPIEQDLQTSPPVQMQQLPQAAVIPQPPQAPSAPTPTFPDSTGKLVAIVTTLRTLYPVPNAKVTVFTGNITDMQVLGSAFTDQSGRTEEFVLRTPAKQLSQEPENTVLPYATYNMMVEADGYIDNIHLNIPVFSGVTSLQSSNMMLYETAGADKGPQIFDELQQFTL